jgi:hypothetical protein
MTNEKSAQSLPGYEPVGPSASVEPSALADLIARVEAATEGSSELNCKIALALGTAWTETLDRPGFKGEYMRGDHGPVTRSLDAALALAERALPGWFVTIDRYVMDDFAGPQSLPVAAASARHRWRAWVKHGGSAGFGAAPTPALALCLAVLRAKAGTPA